MSSLQGVLTTTNFPLGYVTRMRFSFSFFFFNEQPRGTWNMLSTWFLRFDRLYVMLTYGQFCVNISSRICREIILDIVGLNTCTFFFCKYNSNSLLKTSFSRASNRFLTEMFQISSLLLVTVEDSSGRKCQKNWHHRKEQGLSRRGPIY